MPKREQAVTLTSIFSGLYLFRMVFAQDVSTTHANIHNKRTLILRAQVEEGKFRISILTLYVLKKLYAFYQPEKLIKRVFKFISELKTLK